MNTKLMAPIHARMHHVRERERSFGAGFEGRRTDDGFGWSAPLNDFNLGGILNLQCLITHILQAEGTLDRFAEFGIAFINRRLSHG